MSFSSKVLSLIVLVYGVTVSFISVGGLRFYLSELFGDIPNLILTGILLALNILCILSGTSLLLAKEWGRKLIVVISPLIVITYLLLFTTEAISVDVIGIILVLIPALFVYFFSRDKVKEEMK